MIVEERNIGVGGLPIHYLAAGEGPPLVLLHALGESALDWRWVLPALARTNRVYAPDLPGFGGSGKPAADYSPAFFARSVAAYLDALAEALDEPLELRENMPSSSVERWLIFEVAEERPWLEPRGELSKQTGAGPKDGPREEHDGYNVEHTGRTRHGGRGARRGELLAHPPARRPPRQRYSQGWRR